MSITVIEHKGNDSFDVDHFVSEVLGSAEPMLIRGLARNWPAVSAGLQSSDAIAAYLQRFSTAKEVTALLGGAEHRGRLFYNEAMDGFNFEYIRTTLTQAIERLQQSEAQPDPETLYVGSTNVDHWLPGFRSDNDLPMGEYEPLVSVWLGNRSTVAAHYDFPSNIAVVVAGRRRVTLLPPEQLENLYVGPLDLTPAGQSISLVDFSAPDYERFPRFREAEQAALKVELEPGDAIVIPSMWWHHMEALESFNVLVNYWWRDTPAFMGAPLNVLQHALLGLRDLPPEQRAAWERIFDHYVFNPKPENFSHIPASARGVLNPVGEDVAAGLRAALRKKLL